MPILRTRLRVLVLGPLAQHFLRAVEAGERLGDLRADADHLEHRRHQERQKRGEREQAAERQRGGVARIWRAPIYITVPPTIPISTVAERLISEIAVSDLQHVVQQPLHAAGEHARLAGSRRDSPSPRARRPAIR